MILWRISNHIALDGAGGLRASARWHSRGRRIVYCAANPAAALLEILVHLEIDPDDAPRHFRLLRIEAKPGIAEDRLPIKALPRNWADVTAATRKIGDAWLARRRTALLRVPSAIVPETWNVLINPLHPDARRIRVVQIIEHPFDQRLQ